MTAFLTVQQVADRLAISAESVSRLIRAGRLAAVDHGTGRRCYRIPESAVSEYLASAAVASPVPSRTKWAGRPRRTVPQYV